MSRAKKTVSLPVEGVSEETLNRKLPRGVSSLPKEEALQAQRLRLIHGTALAVAEKGYTATTITDITKLAGVSRTTFYELFKDKEDCYLYGFLALSESHLRKVRVAMASTGHLAERCVLAQRAYIERLDVNHAYAYAFIVEAEGASSKVREAEANVRSQLMKMTKNWLDEVRASFPEVPPCSDRTLQMLTVATHYFVMERVREGEKHSDDGMNELARFTFSALGLYGWARKVGSGQPPRWGNPLR